MSFSFLVDVNLPKYFSFFNTNSFIFVSDIDLQMSDTEIWDYALNNDLVILTKDTDFYNRFLVSSTAPKIIYFQLGNCSLKQLHQFICSKSCLKSKDSKCQQIKNFYPNL